MSDRDPRADLRERQAACAHRFPYNSEGVVGDCERCDLPYADWQAQQEGDVARRVARPQDGQQAALAKATERGDIWKAKATEMEQDRDRLTAEVANLRSSARTGAALLRDVAERRDSGQPIDAQALRAASRALDGIAGPGDNQT